MGFYALIPYLALYLSENLMWSMALTGILLGVRQFSQQGFAFLGGILADRWGCKQTLILGLIVRSAGFAFFAFCQEIWHFFIAAVLSGFGGALFDPSLQGAFAKLVPEAHRKQLFSFNWKFIFDTLLPIIFNKCLGCIIRRMIVITSLSPNLELKFI